MNIKRLFCATAVFCFYFDFAVAGNITATNSTSTSTSASNHSQLVTNNSSSSAVSRPFALTRRTTMTVATLAVGVTIVVKALGLMLDVLTLPNLFKLGSILGFGMSRQKDGLGNLLGLNIRQGIGPQRSQIARAFELTVMNDEFDEDFEHHLSVLRSATGARDRDTSPFTSSSDPAISTAFAANRSMAAAFEKMLAWCLQARYRPARLQTEPHCSLGPIAKA